MFYLSVGCAVALGFMLYLASTSLPYLAASPTTDPFFGELNRCLLAALPRERVGFAVGPGAASAVAFTAQQVAVCRRSAPPQVVALAGVRAAAIGFSDVTWLASAEG